MYPAARAAQTSDKLSECIEFLLYVVIKLKVFGTMQLFSHKKAKACHKRCHALYMLYVT